MKAPSVPVDEMQRLVALHSLGILDTPPSESLDVVTRLAGKMLGVPIVLVSLVDAERQWFKSCIGLDATETSRDVSFCGHAIYERRALVIRDASLDPRFADNPMVVNAPFIRAYMGVPLYTLGRHPIGTLCAIDTRPRDFTEEQLENLESFARIVEEFFHSQEMATQTHSVLQFAKERDKRFRETFELAAVGIVHTTIDGKVIRANGRASEILGYTVEELRLLPFIDLTHPDDVRSNMEHFQRMSVGEIDSYRLEKRFLKKDGMYQWVYLSVALKRDDAGRPDYMIAVMEDISQKKQAEAELMRTRDSLRAEVDRQTQQLREQNTTLKSQIIRVLTSESAQREAEGRLRMIANSIPAMIGYWTRQLRCGFANEAYRAWFGFTNEAVEGLPMPQLMGDELFRKNEPYARLALAGSEQHFQRTMPLADNSLAYIDVRYLPEVDDSGEVRGFYVQATDITQLRQTQLELEALNSKLRHDSTTDYLTGIANRRVFTDRSETAAARFREHDELYGLILLDVDNFKNINDHHGHECGDRVLGVLGRILREQLRNSSDIAARLGGEEFAVLCFGNLDEEALRQLAERIRHQINAETLSTAKGSINITCSFGFALCNRDDHDWKSIYARADAAMYEAKSSGKDRVVCGNAIVKGATGRFRALQLSQAQ